MKYPQLRILVGRLYFNTEDVSEILNISENSARVLCARYVAKGLFIRLKKNFYILKERWDKNTPEDFYRLANILQVPSYISLMTALSFYEVTTQVQRGVFESVCIKRSIRYEIEGVAFNFYKLRKELYSGFTKQDNLFIATKEKAFLDAMYLYSFGKYAFDIDSLDINKLDLKKIGRLLKDYPEKTKKLVKDICRI
ncbi:MAG: type IV toxin-antitoxin system AbiEi family antitoxin domain-containing protein [Thermodesulfovibrionales bacterium]